MNVKGLCLSGIVGILSCLGAVHGQAPMYSQQGTPLSAESPTDAPSTAPPPITSLSRYILYERAPGCCGPLGNDGPIGSEVYFRVGAYFPLPSSILSETLNDGWAFSTGARVLFFNPQETGAKTIDLGIVNMYSGGDDPNRLAKVQDKTTLLTVQTSVRSFNQTFVSLSGGYEWYLKGCADPTNDQLKWRVGFDGGGRYGTCKLDTTLLPSMSDVLGGMFLAIHSDIEKPCGRYLLQGGVRAEYGYDWCDVFKSTSSADVQYVNLLLTFGVRF